MKIPEDQRSCKRSPEIFLLWSYTRVYKGQGQTNPGVNFFFKIINIMSNCPFPERFSLKFYYSCLLISPNLTLL